MSLWKQGRGRRRSKAPRLPPETWNVYTSVLNGNHKMNNRKLELQISTADGSSPFFNLEKKVNSKTMKNDCLDSLYSHSNMATNTKQSQRW